jgi:serine/threonine protein kinase
MPPERQNIGRYSLLHAIGSGGMGEVYLATDTLIQRQVAIKVIRTTATSYPHPALQQDATRLFLREARTIARLDHPHILPLLDYGEERGPDMQYAYMVMPFRREGSLINWLEQRGKNRLLSPAIVAYFVQQAASALQYAHSHGVVHQDVKPPNFLVRYHSENPDRPDLLLADFGIAKLMNITAGASQSVRGTPAYMAPEQWKGLPLPASDQYALAIMAYQLLTGYVPFQGRLEYVMYAHLSKQPVPPSQHVAKLPRELDAVLLRALAKNPDERYPSITAFAIAFQRALQERGDLYATLPITRAEALNGINRSITLPGGRRAVILVPAGAYEGQIISLEILSDSSTSESTGGVLTLTITVIDSGERQEQSSAEILPLVTEQTTQPLVQVPTRKIPLQISKQKIPLLIGLLLIILGTSVTGLLFFVNHHNATAKSSLSAHSTSVAASTSVTTKGSAATTYLPGGGVLALNDPLHDNSQKHQWDEGSASCQFEQDGYHVSTQAKGYTFYCNAYATNFGNFAYEVQMTLLKAGSGGLVFRANGDNSTFYYFRVDNTGSYMLIVFTGHTGANVLEAGTATAFHTGLGKSNLLAIVANGDHITLYVNQVRITIVTDSTYTQGQIGIAASSSDNTPIEARFNNAKVWTV